MASNITKIITFLNKLIWRYNRSVEEDSKKIDDILKKLNGTKNPPVWVVAEGFHTMTAVSFMGGTSGKDAVFNPASGIIVKSFVNTKTGEIKPYFYKKVVRD